MPPNTIDPRFNAYLQMQATLAWAIDLVRAGGAMDVLKLIQATGGIAQAHATLVQRDASRKRQADDAPVAADFDPFPSVTRW